MILTLEEVKNYLRLELEFTEDDNFLKTLIQGAESYLNTHIGNEIYLKIQEVGQEKQKEKAKIYLLVLISEWYDNRTMIVSEDLRPTLQLIGNQFKYGVDVNV